LGTLFIELLIMTITITFQQYWQSYFAASALK